jgi:hypothetical protein
MENPVRIKLVRIGFILLLAGIGVRAIVTLLVIVSSFSTPYDKDLRSGYLLAQAMANGVDPYLPLPELSQHWLPEHPITLLNHPTPHPFTLGWLFLPLLLFSYERAAIIWLMLQLFFLTLAGRLLLQILQIKLAKQHAFVVALLLLSSWPLAMELWWGQMNLLLLLLALVSWQAFQQGREVTGGVLLGCTLALKLVGWPIILWLATQRKWRAVWAAGFFWMAAHLLAVGFHGWAMIRDYYLKVGPLVSSIYRVRELNLSAWTIGQRLFAESGYHIVTVPVWNSPFLVKSISVLTPLVVLVLALRTVIQAKPFDIAFAIMLSIGTLLNPISWLHYFILALPAVALLFKRLKELSWPGLETLIAAALGISLWLPGTIYLDLAKLFSSGVAADGRVIVPAIPALLTLLPAVALCCLLWLLAQLSIKATPVQPSYVE